jgi:hypothetical protein
MDASEVAVTKSKAHLTMSNKRMVLHNGRRTTSERGEVGEYVNE